jgi:hypothetical protein
MLHEGAHAILCTKTVMVEAATPFMLTISLSKSATKVSDTEIFL